MKQHDKGIGKAGGGEKAERKGWGCASGISHF